MTRMRLKFRAHSLRRSTGVLVAFYYGNKVMIQPRTNDKVELLLH